MFSCSCRCRVMLEEESAGGDWIHINMRNGAVSPSFSQLARGTKAGMRLMPLQAPPDSE